MNSTANSTINCACGLPTSYENCCQPFHEGLKLAPSAEKLMRSRYSAFALKKMDYILKTHDPLTLHQFNLEENKKWAESVTFFKLEVLHAKENGEQAEVIFKAHYKINATSKIHIHEEHSHFRRALDSKSGIVHWNFYFLRI
jgi:SEC-C motif-containing protein